MAVNGTYRSPVRGRAPPVNRGRALAVIGVLLMLLGGAGSYQANAQMVTMEQAAGQRFSEVGSGLTRLLPSILTSLSKANAAFNSPGRTISPDDPRGSPAYARAKSALERWVAVGGLGLALLLLGLDERRGLTPAPGAEPGAPTHVPISTDIARFVLLVAFAWAAFSLFETG